MMHSELGTSPDRRALVVIPGNVNYFYNLSGRRIAESLGELGFGVDVRTLADCPDDDYEWCALSNISEILHNFGDEEAGIARIDAIRQRCGSMASLAIDCVSTPWYKKICDLSARAGVETILDLGLCDQSKLLSEAERSRYRFLLSGLTPSEEQILDGWADQDVERGIPWAFVGHITPTRSALVDHLVQHVDPRGFVYMPMPAPYTEKGSPHLNQQQFDRVLLKTRYQVWCSHHAHFYMEPERFRTSLLTGGVPIKVVASRDETPRNAPLSYLMMEARDLGERLSERSFERIRQLFWQDWRQFPTLSQELKRFLPQTGVALAPAPSQAAA